MPDEHVEPALKELAEPVLGEMLNLCRENMLDRCRRSLLNLCRRNMLNQCRRTACRDVTGSIFTRMVCWSPWSGHTPEDRIRWHRRQ